MKKLFFIPISFLLFVSFSIIFPSQKKIVGLMAARNEAPIIAQSLRALACYTDAIVLLDDASTDDTLKVVESLKQDCRIEVIITKDHWYRDEPGDRNKLLEAGRAIGGTHFICIDADEMFTANCMDHNCLREYILTLQPGQSLALFWIQLWRSTRQYRCDSSVWSYRPKEIIFCDDGRCNYSSEFIHTNPIPKLNGKKKVLSSYVYGLLHFQFVNWENLLIKQSWYRCLERIRQAEKNESEINQRYSPSKDESGLQIKKAPDYWFEKYSFFDPSVWDSIAIWRKDDVRSWFGRYGKHYFKNLDIWNVDWDDDTLSKRIPMYICTACDAKYFEPLLNLIGSLYRVNRDDIHEIAVFDIGLSADQIKHLEKIEKVSVYDIEKTHPDILKPVVVNKDGKKVPGWYAWKAVVLKQALDKFEYVLFLDAGTTVLNPLNKLFEYIIDHKYFLVDCGHDIAWMTTRYVIEKLELERSDRSWILDKNTQGCAAGVIGLTRDIQNVLVKPLYDLSYNLDFFKDDGTTPNGFGTGRYEQALLSIFARLASLDVAIEDNGDGRIIELFINNKIHPLHITWDKKLVRDNTTLYHSRWDLSKKDYFKQFIIYKKG